MGNASANVSSIRVEWMVSTACTSLIARLNRAATVRERMPLQSHSSLTVEAKQSVYDAADIGYDR